MGKVHPEIRPLAADTRPTRATNKKTVAVWFGTVAMFEAERFGKVATLGRTNLVMRLTL